MAKELGHSHNGKESRWHLGRVMPFFLALKDSVSLIGLDGCCVERNSMPCLELVLCS